MSERVRACVRHLHGDVERVLLEAPEVLALGVHPTLARPERRNHVQKQLLAIA